ncbi:hypothetical protein CEXT_434981 [Caerostris extrusa]|uniref:Uncharacterized protein n=1 Tax=Caerostris extrusa TaxID=172846 RepID=A0AAV4RTH2_CAEEX|nr:hypothetical protein CEXT_434981 [Caerostris extrusa]
MSVYSSSPQTIGHIGSQRQFPGRLVLISGTRFYPPCIQMMGNLNPKTGYEDNDNRKNLGALMTCSGGEHHLGSASHELVTKVFENKVIEIGRDPVTRMLLHYRRGEVPSPDRCKRPLLETPRNTRYTIPLSLSMIIICVPRIFNAFIAFLAFCVRKASFLEHSDRPF